MAGQCRDLGLTPTDCDILDRCFRFQARAIFFVRIDRPNIISTHVVVDMM